MSASLVCIDDYEKYALSVLPRDALDFYRSGAGSQQTLADNRQSFLRYKIRPRFLRDVSNRNSSTTILGKKISMPIGISPTALQKMAHADGEVATARAAEAMGTIFILSTASSTSIEEVAKAAPNCIKWFQLYVFKDRNVTRSLVERAEKAGYEALVLTVDLPVLGIRHADVRNKFTLPQHLTYANFDSLTQQLKNSTNKVCLKDYINAIYDSSLQWNDIKWLKTITTLPIILKGVLTAEDALLAAEVQVDGIIVSNHGGRQLDDTFATIDVLEEIVQAVGNKMEIYMDGGIRDGVDVFKALALGAKMVFIGRPALWGLAHSGEDGVNNVLNILRNEFDTTLALSGCRGLGDIRREMVVHVTRHWKL
ncbi:hypothetical protein HHI36_005966 [Cryptolaemus montrouzieri]|uniref:(S)-2-hydroxy-acid oxidase n=1 Tax=Cryptolaemus montrouzieri TaxID=559131 RepID=A0ABD2NVM0_9CUCU